MVSSSKLVLSDGRTFDLNGSCTLGRSASNTVSLDNSHVSRKHAIIQFQGGDQFWIVDLGSSNGTYVNSRRVSRPIALKDGDVIEVGGTRIEFHSEGLAADTDSQSLGSTLLSVARRNCWLMVADIVGSTRMAQELPPEEVPLLTGGWFKTCRDLIEAHGGHMNQYLGDGFFCYWEDTLQSKERILEAMVELARLQESASPPFRVVLHCGMTVLGSVPTMTDVNLHGPTVNFVFRMEKLAAGWSDSRLCSEAALAALGLPSLVERESAVAGFEGRFRFHVPDLAGRLK
jgi:adenylate cyclase